MPVYRLTRRPLFPEPELAEPGGLLAVGGDLSPVRLLLAYSMGIFPWFNEGEPILWWSPESRCVLLPEELRVSRSLAKLRRREVFSVTFDQAFREVMESCAEVRKQSGEGTWITPEMLEAYGRLYDMGFAHSVECWKDGRLAGGLYGVCLGRCFFGESMFHRIANTSKIAFAALADHLRQREFEMIDCQLPTDHLKSLGAREIPRGEFLDRLVKGGVLPSSMPPPGDFF